MYDVRMWEMRLLVVSGYPVGLPHLLTCRIWLHTISTSGWWYQWRRSTRTMSFNSIKSKCVSNLRSSSNKYAARKSTSALYVAMKAAAIAPATTTTTTKKHGISTRVIVIWSRGGAHKVNWNTVTAIKSTLNRSESIANSLCIVHQRVWTQLNETKKREKGTYTNILRSISTHDTGVFEIEWVWERMSGVEKKRAINLHPEIWCWLLFYHLSFEFTSMSSNFHSITKKCRCG